MPRIPDPAPVPAGIRTLADFLHWLGDIPAERILLRPPPGMGNASDVLRLERQENHLCELICGVAVEKRLGYKEMSVAAVLLAALQEHVEAKQLGAVTGPEGFYRLSEHLVRIPSVAFCSVGELRGDVPPGEAAAGIVPQLVAEVIEGPTTTELQRRIEDYFASGVKIVWVIDLESRTAAIYTSAKKFKTVPARASLEGGRLLGGFKMPLARLFDHFGAKRKK